MPYVNIKITREGGTTPAQKSALIRGVTDLLVDVLRKSPATTFVVIDEVEIENWGVGGVPVTEFRRLQAEGRTEASAARPAAGSRSVGRRRRKSSR
jgi:4-oxalocrotonate tautomerase